MKKILDKIVKLPEFEIVSSPTIMISDLKRRRLDIIDWTATELSPITLGVIKGNVS